VDKDDPMASYRKLGRLLANMRDDLATYYDEQRGWKTAGANVRRELRKLGPALQTFKRDVLEVKKKRTPVY
jgi:hypothetical protein